MFSNLQLKHVKRVKITVNDDIIKYQKQNNWKIFQYVKILIFVLKILFHSKLELTIALNSIILMFIKLVALSFAVDLVLNNKKTIMTIWYKYTPYPFIQVLPNMNEGLQGKVS